MLTPKEHIICKYYASLYKSRYNSYEELLSEAYLAVCECINKYGKARALALVRSFVRRRIWWFILRDIRYRTKPSHDSVIIRVNPESIIGTKEQFELFKDNEKRIIELRDMGYNGPEIGAIVGVSKQRIHQIEQQVRRKI